MVMNTFLLAWLLNKIQYTQSVFEDTLQKDTDCLFITVIRVLQSLRPQTQCSKTLTAYKKIIKKQITLICDKKSVAADTMQ